MKQKFSTEIRNGIDKTENASRNCSKKYMLKTQVRFAVIDTKITGEVWNLRTYIRQYNTAQVHQTDASR